MTCAKIVVTARLVLPDGRFFLGCNDCASPQAECPRLPGEGYAKCKSICEQTGHAEEIAIHLARGEQLVGATMEVRHTHICINCQLLCDWHGIEARLV